MSISSATGKPTSSEETITTSNPPLLFRQVSKWYGPVLGVNKVSLELRSGITGLVGSNGAGKTTLMRLATGQIVPDQGDVLIAGSPARRTIARRLVGYSPDLDAFYEEMSGRRFILSMARLCGYRKKEARARTEQVLEKVGMTHRSDRKLRGYSKGMRQRIKLAQALLHDPVLLILDEPLSGIDPVGRRELIELFLTLSSEGKCLLISSHELEELEKLTDHIVIMARGRVAAVGTVEQIRGRLHNHPLTIRLDIRRHSGEEHRELAALLVQLPELNAVEVSEDPFERTVGRLLIRARQPEILFQKIARLVLEHSFDICHLETTDESTSALLGYLLGGST